MYDVKSARAEDFINDEEILDTLNYSAKHKSSCVFTETELFFLRRFIFLIIALTRALTALIMFTTNT